MDNKIYSPNSDGKFEFQFSKEIGTDYKGKNQFSYQYAKNIIEVFVSEFGITNEPVVIEANVLTYTAMLAGFLEDYGELISQGIDD